MGCDCQMDDAGVLLMHWETPHTSKLTFQDEGGQNGLFGFTYVPLITETNEGWSLAQGRALCRFSLCFYLLTYTCTERLALGCAFRFPFVIRLSFSCITLNHLMSQRDSQANIQYIKNSNVYMHTLYPVIKELMALSSTTLTGFTGTFQ